MLATLFLMFLSSQVLASVTSKNGKVTYVSNGWGGEGLYIGLDTSSGCPNTAFVVSPNRSDYKSIAAIAMLALSLDKSVRIDYETCTGGGGNGANVIGISLAK